MTSDNLQATGPHDVDDAGRAHGVRLANGPHPTHDPAASRHRCVRLFEDWTAMWNGDLALADRILAPGFRVHFGNVIAADTDALRGPAAMAAFIAAHRAAKPGLDYRMHGTPVVEISTRDGAPAGLVVCRWSVSRPGGTGPVSGIDMLSVHAGLITDVWSLSGDRTFGTDAAKGSQRAPRRSSSA